MSDTASEARIAELESKVETLTSALVEVTKMRVGMNAVRHYPKPCEGNWSLRGVGQVEAILKDAGLM